MDASVQPAWLVYLLECADGSLYCGITTNMERRLAQHNGLAPGGARYTQARRPVRLVAVRPCPGRPAALRLERYVKSRPRHCKIHALQEGDAASCNELQKEAFLLEASPCLSDA